MLENQKKSEFAGVSGLPVGVPPPGNLSATALARRKMLLTSLGKGSAVVAAVAVPMQSLAAIGTLSITANGKRCTISGVMSAVHSNEKVTDVCTGRSPTFYKSVTNWPNYNATTGNASNVVVGGGNFDQNTRFKALFGGGSNSKLIDILTNPPNIDNEFHWVTALLNGTSGSLSANFPYTNFQVIGFYKAGGTVQQNALDFFIGYMETT